MSLRSWKRIRHTVIDSKLKMMCYIKQCLKRYSSPCMLLLPGAWVVAQCLGIKRYQGVHHMFYYSLPSLQGQHPWTR